MDKTDSLVQARQNLLDYLRVNSLRNTPERNALLDVIYSTDAPIGSFPRMMVSACTRGIPMFTVTCCTEPFITCSINERKPANVSMKSCG